jgi:glutamine synthetase
MASNASQARLEAILNSTKTRVRKIERPVDSLGKALPVSDFFGSMTFGLDQLKEKLSRDSFNSLQAMVQKGKRLEQSAADEIASVIKDWANTNGATHFCHWFQPMNGLTAEKHDAFIQTKTSDLGQTHVIEKFSGSHLLQSEPDASSFPSGGMRTTFEARGYTAWDATSPLFIIESVNGKTLCIPSAFVSYNGVALDHKTPLLRSVQAISREATRFLKILGEADVHDVKVTLGAEQEYFLIDQSYHALRPDLVMTGRTLLGRNSTRNQQFEDHYFGSIPTRVLAFMQELEQEMYKLGVPIKTRHNEVAPSQFEVAPIFEELNVSIDHNCLLMDMMRRIATRHGFVCLIHEKPFAGINGSGKHCNWSMSTNRGDNLLEPGRTPHQNLRFLAVLTTVLKALHENSGVIRSGIASPGNDHRLGANEAPPAIMSAFLGETLSGILDRIEKNEVIQDSATEAVINLNVSNISVVAKDNTDRNRTSPFAFTGNKFEFRAVGASANVAFPLSILNASVSNAFRFMSDRLEKKLASAKSRDDAVMELIREVVKETKAVRFEGNNYDEAWKKEAKSRGLPELRNMAEAIQPLEDAKQTQFLMESGVFTVVELKARHNVLAERYIKQIELEAATLAELVDTYVLPSCERELSSRAGLQAKLEKASSKSALKRVTDRLQRAERLYTDLAETRDDLVAGLSKMTQEKDEHKKLKLCAESLMPLMQKTRGISDDVEAEISDEYWALPKYREMLFLN